MHLANTFIQSDLQSIQAINFFCQYVCSLEIEPTTFCAAKAMLYHWATGTLYKIIFSMFCSIKGVIWCFCKDHYFCVFGVTVCCHVQKTHSFSNTVHYCRSSMTRLSQTHCFLQSPSFRQALSALIGQLAQCIVIGRTPQATLEMLLPFP